MTLGYVICFMGNNYIFIIYAFTYLLLFIFIEQVMTIYIPTLLIIMVSYLTTFFNNSKWFGHIITINLTVRFTAIFLYSVLLCYNNCFPLIIFPLFLDIIILSNRSIYKYYNSIYQIYLQILELYLPDLSTNIRILSTRSIYKY